LSGALFAERSGAKKRERKTEVVAQKKIKKSALEAVKCQPKNSV
jgi:hypothetical protein